MFGTDSETVIATSGAKGGCGSSENTNSNVRCGRGGTKSTDSGDMGDGHVYAKPKAIINTK